LRSRDFSLSLNILIYLLIAIYFLSRPFKSWIKISNDGAVCNHLSDMTASMEGKRKKL